MIITNFFAPIQNHSALQNLIFQKITPCMNRTFQSFKQRLVQVGVIFLEESVGTMQIT